MKLAKILKYVSIAWPLAATSQFGHASIKMDVYIDSNTEVFVPMSRKISAFNVHKVDALKINEERISKLLPKDPKLAQERIASFVESGEYKQYAQDLIDSWSSISSVVGRGIKKVPAVVINDKYVVYGMSPQKALIYYDAHIIKYGSQ
ncbi:hypothetical protein A1QO_00625 [Vibrio genomosp. F10 str. ZF-129]|uniref:Integrating conjugative element protein n=1 Tax=Vibrio genomosp. F10 str. ZF-129 TaxID=1187848 RepID=A0A1E5BG99_9VIBR|nr:DUF1525 domain-containing protein [Vibrio genomosp. F10]OEE35296.1 hypothetical protein A1QO_00625 [Vibrio genomosp. F10 str. ZF-129]